MFAEEQAYDDDDDNDDGYNGNDGYNSEGAGQSDASQGTRASFRPDSGSSAASGGETAQKEGSPPLRRSPRGRKRTAHDEDSQQPDEAMKDSPAGRKRKRMQSKPISSKRNTKKG